MESKNQHLKLEFDDVVSINNAKGALDFIQKEQKSQREFDYPQSTIKRNEE